MRYFSGTPFESLISPQLLKKEKYVLSHQFPNSRYMELPIPTYIIVISGLLDDVDKLKGQNFEFRVWQTICSSSVAMFVFLAGQDGLTIIWRFSFIVGTTKNIKF